MGANYLKSIKTEEISFYQALTGKQRKMIVNSERHNREELGLKKIDNAVIDKIIHREKLKGINKKKKTKRRLIGLTSYNILDNHQYQIAFQYVPPHIENGHHHDDDHGEEEGSANEIDEFSKEASK